MNFNNQYCVFKKGLPIEFCNKIISQANSQNKNKASVSNKDSTKRISNITWLNESWINETLKPYIDKANQDCVGTYNGIILKKHNSQNMRKDNTISGT